MYAGGSYVGAVLVVPAAPVVLGKPGGAASWASGKRTASVVGSVLAGGLYSYSITGGVYPGARKGFAGGSYGVSGLCCRVGQFMREKSAQGIGRTGATKAEFAELIVLILEYCDRRAAVFMEAVSSAIFNALRCLAFFTATHMSRAMTMTMRAPE